MKQYLFLATFLATLVGCNENNSSTGLKSQSEPTNDMVAAWLSTRALPGVKVSEVKSICMIDRVSKTGRVSVKLTATRQSPTYRTLEDNQLRLHLLKQGLTEGELERFYKRPYVYTTQTPAGTSHVETYELETQLSVDGWRFGSGFSSANPGSSFEGDPQPSQYAVAIDSPALKDYIASVLAYRNAEKLAWERQTQIFKKLEKVLLAPKCFRLRRGGDRPVMLIFKLEQSLTITEDRSYAFRFSAPLRVIEGYEPSGYKLKSPITAAHVSGSCIYEDGLESIGKRCRFTISPENSTAFNFEFEFDGDKYTSLDELQSLEEYDPKSSPQTSGSKEAKTAVDLIVGVWKYSEGQTTYSDDGKIQYLFNDGTVVTGRWSIEEESSVLTIIVRGKDHRFQILEISESKARYKDLQTNEIGTLTRSK